MKFEIISEEYINKALKLVLDAYERRMRND